MYRRFFKKRPGTRRRKKNHEKNPRISHMIKADICSSIVDRWQVMFSKRARGYDESATDPAKRFRRNIGDAFLSNAMSAARSQSLINDAHAAGAAHLGDLIEKKPGDRHANLARNLLRRFGRKNKWPKQYTANIRMKDRKTGEARKKYNKKNKV